MLATVTKITNQKSSQITHCHGYNYFCNLQGVTTKYIFTRSEK